MKYMGSKNRIAKHILPIMLDKRKEGQYWVEPFVGGANMIDKVDGNRIGADFNEYMIALFKELQKGWIPPDHITKAEYENFKKNPDKQPHLTAYCATSLSFGSKWFGGWVNKYGENKKRKDGTIPCRQLESKRSVVKQTPLLKNIKFIHSGYQDLEIPPNSKIYCDPPYADTTGYKDKFSHHEFWQWCRDMEAQGHEVYISEYNAPDDFECIWQQEVRTNMDKNKSQIRIEKLFRLSKSVQKIQ